MPFATDNVAIHHLIELQASKTPDAIAATFQSQRLTYQELNEKANQLAHHLQTLGVKSETLVGICVERSLNLLIALLGILKAGGAYVPLDPNYPQDRLAFVIDDTQLPVLITQHSLLPLLPQADHAHVLCLDIDWQTVAQQPTENLVSLVTADHLAYVIYTSGSTGKPKGVQITHQAAVNFLRSMQAEPGLTHHDILLAVTTISFDIAVLELFLPLSVGAGILLVSRELASNGALLSKLLSESKATVMQATPATWRMLLSAGWRGKKDLKMLCGGEALTRSLANQLLERGDSLWQMYGPTETTVWSMVGKVGPGEGAVPLGHAIANTQIYLIEEPARRRGDTLKLAAPGVPGEVFIGGEGVARGYFNRPELTQEKFIRDPFSTTPRARLYRTGDLARSLPDGSIQYIGRIDHQVKIRGHRIELGDIEAALSQHDDVKETVVIAHGNDGEEKRLVAYIAPKSDVQVTEPNGLAPVAENAEITSQWQKIWSAAYSEAVNEHDPTFNIAGWNSSYTGKMTPAHELKEWVQHTVDRILALRPQKILEIGCGTGLLLFRLAPYCSHYIGTDISAEAIRYIDQQLQKTYPHGSNVTLYQKAADALENIEPQSVDTIVLNSVIQYFPNIDYLVNVLKMAVRAVKPGGHIFVGDVRSLPLLEAFHTSVQLHQSVNSGSTTHLQQRIRDRINHERELVIDPRFFTAFQHHFPQVDQVQVQIKRGSYHNELTRFRYDVVLQVETSTQPDAEPIWLDWQQQTLTLSKIRQFLLEEKPERVSITGIPNARIAAEMTTLQVLTSSECPNTIEDLWKQLEHQLQRTGVDPEEVWQLSQDVAYDVSINWSASGEIGCYDVLLQQRSPGVQVANAWAIAALPASQTEMQPLSTYANNPTRTTSAKDLIPKLRAFLREKLPAFMIPSTFMVLESLPLTPNGKIDRRALPAPSQARPDLEAVYVAPQTKVEEQLASLWSQMLGIEQIGVHDSFFELGGHSLLVTQLMAHVEETFQIELSLIALFQSPTIAGLAQAINAKRNPAKNATLQHSDGESASDKNDLTWVDLQADTVLAPSIYSKGTLPTLVEPQAIFLTGATGFLGAFLLQELLEQTLGKVYCLVRASTEEEGMQKIAQNLARYRLNHPEYASRIVPVLGDLAQPLLGLSHQDFQELAGKIDLIYHNGAFVNLIYPYTALRAANVLGTQEVLKLACQCKTKPVHFISTLDVFHSSAYADTKRLLEQDDLLGAEGLYNGYAQSKWVAEKLIMAARDRGIPTCIFRAGMIVGHDQTGVSKTDDLISRIIKGLIQLGKAPNLELNMNLTPVNYISQTIVHLSRQPESWGKAFHLVNPHFLPLEKLVQHIKSLNYSIQLVTYEQWQAELSALKSTQNNALSPLISLFSEKSGKPVSLETLALQRVDCQNTIVGLANTEIQCLPIDDSVLETYFSYFIESGFLNIPERHSLTALTTV
ncbi:amino acid adenylation domain-containing protein [Myxacorys almedinensis]|uniref:Amino acid adenylation domain-containing protein n=1 Tax=Myxacorys almedinensis A TaxID=2690445 RepID=A0A8J7Z766_9CYAN|nr:amino acid adenylation domain-containing protein [Myxacorys almedinensis]NDJ19166.1 amino acid adenylation domain-containing protein [Myxacorys almedinensis A]